MSGFREKYLANIEPEREPENIIALSDYSEAKHRFDCLDICRINGIEISEDGRNIVCPLPGHDDTDASFGLYNENKKFKCFGCNASGSSIDLHAALNNMSAQDAVADLLGKETSGYILAAKTRKTKKPAKTRNDKKLYTRPIGGIEYDYSDTLKKVRYLKNESKIFAWCHCDGGKWYWGRGGQEPGLFVRGGTLKPGATVYLVEGEKDALTIESLGLIGVSKPGTTDQWSDDWCEALDNCDVIIIPDNDATGRSFADEAAVALRSRAARWKVVRLPDLPEKGDVTDWIEAGNTAADLARECDAVAFEAERIQYYADARSNDKHLVEMPIDDGMNMPAPLRDFAQWYNATAFRPQPGFAIVSAMALGSIVCARNFCTTMNNFSSLYFLTIANSGTGKEHGKTCIERALRDAGFDGDDRIEDGEPERRIKPNLMAGSGYTSLGGVFYALLNQPQHIVIIDEFGHLLKSEARASNGNLLEARTALMEAWGRCHNRFSARQYSQAGKKDADKIPQHVNYPAITLLGMTTPSTFFASCSMDHVSDGFLNRFFVYRSQFPREINRDAHHASPPPSSTIDWINAIWRRLERENFRSEWKPSSISIPREITESYYDFVRATDRKMNELDKNGMSDIYTRTAEKALRLALIYTLAEDPEATKLSHLAWARAASMSLWFDQHQLHILEHSMANSEWEQAKMEVLMAIRETGKKGITMRMMKRTKPYSKYKEIEKIIIDLTEGGTIMPETRARKNCTGRKPAPVYVAIKPTKED
ncbi:MAG: DUF3987 domain-containing protein [Victivallaceae bacterium]|nr:DUF3987 domain-containing protein [Victivallaceae bacterium]